MATDVTVEQQIARDREAVAAYAMDPANDRSWIGGLTEVEVLTSGPVGRGSQVKRVAKFMGKRIEYVNEIVEYEPPERIVMRSVKAPFPLTVTYEFAAADGGTRMRIHTGGDASGFYRLGGPLLDRMVRRGVASDLARLKRILES
jgi:uncharacterized protein YndB with AHSA1/START domain